MSLKAFHIAFICISILLALGFAGWMIREYSRTGDALTLAGGFLSILAGVALVVYAYRFLRKLKNVRML